MESPDPEVCSDTAPVLPNSASASRRVTWSDNHSYHSLPPPVSTSAGDQDQEDGEQASCFASIKQKVKALKQEVLALYYAIHDPRTPLIAKILPWMAIAYALSPLDLIPDFIPVLGLLDDFLILPALIWLSIHLIPHQVMEDCRVKAALEPLQLHRTWYVAALIAAAWTACLLVAEHFAIQRYGHGDLLQYEWAALAGTGGLCCILFVLWLMLRVKHEKRRREEWNAALLQHEGGFQEPQPEEAC